MKQSTASVVQGGELAEDAGQALVRFERVVEDLAKSVCGISQSSQGRRPKPTRLLEL